MKKKLPELTITGTLQQLIELEMILIMLGYNKSYENWNNQRVALGYKNSDRIIAYNDGQISYHFHIGFPYNFKATQIKKIIDFVLNYKN